MRKLMIEIEKHNLVDDAQLLLMLIDVERQLNEGDDVEFKFAPDTVGMRVGVIYRVEQELRPNCRKLIYCDPNGKRRLLGLNGKARSKKLKPAS